MQSLLLCTHPFPWETASLPKASADFLILLLDSLWTQSLRTELYHIELWPQNNQFMNWSNPMRLYLKTLNWVIWELSYIKGSPEKGSTVRTHTEGRRWLLEMAFEVCFFSKTEGTGKDAYKGVLRYVGELRFLELETEHV